MERLNLNNSLNKAFLACAVILFGFGVWIHTTKPKIDTKKRTEQELVAMAAPTVLGMDYTRSTKPTEEGMSYRMDDATYKLLAPFGIVARQYTNGADVYDAVLIASRSRASFHDPRVCFSGQGWTLEKFTASSVKTQSRGEVPITLITMSSAASRNKLAAFFYKGPRGEFYGSTQALKWSLFLEQLRLGDDLDGVFYRVIPMTDGVNEEQLKTFIGAWLDELNTSSKGYF